MTRRTAIALVATSVGYIHGRPVAANFSAQSAQSERSIVLPLDGLAGIMVQYRGRSVLVRPDEIMAALMGEGK